jgi:hypothetical protein
LLGAMLVTAFSIEAIYRKITGRQILQSSLIKGN